MTPLSGREDRPLRIGFDVAQTCQERAGCGWYADALAHALAATDPDGHELWLYHQFGGWINPHTDDGTTLPENGTAARVQSPFREISPAAATTVWEEVRMGRATLPGNPHVVHANSFQAPAVRPARLVFTVHDVSFWTHPEFHTDANRVLCQQGMLQALTYADGFLFVSHSAREDFESILPGWLERHGKVTAVIPEGPRGLPAASLLPASFTTGAGGGEDGDGEFWLAVGSLEPRKNYGTLLDALELYWQRSPRPLPLRIAGGAGWRSENLRRRLYEAGARGRVTHLGYVPDAGLAHLYAGARALVFPSWHEGFGLPVVEAMAAGCPVLCSDRASLPEVGGDAVRYVDPGSAESIATAMLTLEADRAGRADLVTAGRARAGLFSWERTARETLAFYRRVLARA